MEELGGTVDEITVNEENLRTGDANAGRWPVSKQLTIGSGVESDRRQMAKPNRENPRAC
jgi:hypothetical protein